LGICEEAEEARATWQRAITQDILVIDYATQERT